jgi:ubiquinone/menaquinone biosynthesis C-methylase UbiE
MLHQCQKKWATSTPKQGIIQLICADMCNLPIIRKFNYVIIPFTTFNYLSNANQYLECLRRVCSLMTENAILCVELLTKNTVPGIFEHSSMFEMAWSRQFPNKNTELQYWRRAFFDPLSQIIVQERRYIEVDPNNRSKISQKYVIWRNRIIFDDEFSDVMDRSNLSIIGKYGDYSLDRLTEKSNTAIYIVRRKPGK